MNRKRLAEIAGIGDKDIDTSDIPEATEAQFGQAKLVAAEKWFTWTARGRADEHDTFAAAEKAAKASVRSVGRVDIRRHGRLVATVAIDSLDRVWTDVVDTDVALV